jgi:hypothetical protein
MYLSLEAGRAELPTATALKDLYEGYTAYFSPDSKDYESLTRMARHLPAYQGVVEALESGEYSRAKEMVSSLPPGRPREILSREIEGVERRLSSLKERTVEALKAGEYALAGELASEYEDLAESIGATDPRVSIMKGVASGIASGRMAEGEGREILSFLEEFREWRVEEEPEPTAYEPAPTSPPETRGQPRPWVLGGIALAALAAIVAVGLAVKKRKAGSRRR